MTRVEGMGEAREEVEEKRQGSKTAKEKQSLSPDLSESRTG